MNSSLIAPVLYFLVGLTVASTVGMVSYVLIRLSCEQPHHTWLFICAFVALLGSAMLLMAMPTVWVCVCGLLPLWVLATFADRNVQPSEERWGETFFKIVVAGACASLVAGLVLVFMNEVGMWQSLTNIETKWFSSGYLVGSLFVPSVFALFLWIWKTIQIRPGLERHLREGEKSR